MIDVLQKALYLTNWFPMSRALFLVVTLSAITAFPAAAQNLNVEFYEGRVSVDATAVPVRTILTEWGKVGGTKIIGAEKITGFPLTVKLINVTEAQALETILRSVAGYMAAPRNTGTGLSMYDRILVMATTSAPPPPARPAPATTTTPVSTARSDSFHRGKSNNGSRPSKSKSPSRMRIRRVLQSSRSHRLGKTASPISRDRSTTRRRTAPANRRR